MKKDIKIYEEFTSANIIGITLEHNGYCGGDAGHGGYVKITIEDVASTSMEVNGYEAEKVELLFRGDTERDTLLSGLEWIVKELKKEQRAYGELDFEITSLSLKENNFGKKDIVIDKVKVLDSTGKYVKFAKLNESLIEALKNKGEILIKQ
jgi:hypothetical protein